MTAYLLGFAAAAQDADPDEVEALAARAQELAEGWDRPADAPDPDDVDDPIPDDRTVDHTGETYDDDRADELVDEEVVRPPDARRPRRRGRRPRGPGRA